MEYIQEFTGGNTNYNMDDIMRVQKSNQSAINEMFSDYIKFNKVSTTNKSFIISGGVVTVTAGVTIAITEGYYYSGVEEQVIKIDAQSIAHVVGKLYHLLPTETFEVEGDKTYADGQSRQTWRKIRGVVTQYDTEQTTLYDTEQYLYLSEVIGELKFRYGSVIDYTYTDVTAGAWVTFDPIAGTTGGTTIPFGSTRVLVTVKGKHLNAAGDIFQFRRTGDTFTSYNMRADYDDRERYQFLIPLSVDGKFDVKAPGTVSDFTLQIDGYQ